MSEAPRPPVIGLAGGIGAGKSTVARLLEALGCVVVDSDETARRALRDPAIRATLLEWWGEAVLGDDGAIDRSAVARIVFADAGQLRRLEALMHPWIEARRREQFDAAAPGTPALVIDAPLLFETGLDAQCDAVIFVEADLDERRRRVAERGWTEGELEKRELSQMRLDEKRERADHVVTNHGNPDDLRSRVQEVFQDIVTRQAPGKER